jgi:hypothetical protein
MSNQFHRFNSFNCRHRAPWVPLVPNNQWRDFAIEMGTTSAGAAIVIKFGTRPNADECRIRHASSAGFHTGAKAPTRPLLICQPSKASVQPLDAGIEGRRGCGCSCFRSDDEARAAARDLDAECDVGDARVPFMRDFHCDMGERPAESPQASNAISNMGFE